MSERNKTLDGQRVQVLAFNGQKLYLARDKTIEFDGNKIIDVKC